MKTKPFNLEEALAGKKVVTRDGQPVTEIVAFKSPLRYPVRYIVDGIAHLATNEGLSSSGLLMGLFMVVETKTYYRNSCVYDRDALVKSGYHLSEETAKAAAKTNKKARYFEIAIPVEVEME